MSRYLMAFAIAFSALTAIQAKAETAMTNPINLSNFQCMAVKGIYGPDGSNFKGVPVFAGPTKESQPVGIENATVIVSSPLNPVGGRTQVLRPNGAIMWIDVDQLTEWHALADPTAKCSPRQLSNGHYAFHTHH